LRVVVEMIQLQGNPLAIRAIAIDSVTAQPNS
jgi:hypothetical protein